jgi:regulatory protein
MKRVITALRRQKRREDRVNLYLDGEFAFGLPRSLAVSLEVGQELTPEEIQRLKVQEEEEQAYQRALRLISRRQRSEWELRRYFNRREVSDLAQDAVIERLKQRKLVDDYAFAEAWIENRNAFRPRGAFALRMELKKKGVPDAIIREALQGFDDQEAARSAARKGARKWKQSSEREFKRRLGGYLRRRGFQYAIISDVVAEAWQEVERRSKESEGDE